MAKGRHREQKGRLYRENGVWFLRYYDDRTIAGEIHRKRITKRLGIMTKNRAERAAKPYLDTVNGVHRAGPENSLTLAAFVAEIYFPAMERRGLRPSTLHGYRILWNALKDYCAHLWLRETGVPEVQKVLDEIAATRRLNKNSLKHAKAFLSGVFKLALQRGAYANNFNPVQQTSIPDARKPEETHAYSLEEIDAMLAVLPDPAATVIATAAYTGARRGELRGMLWENYKKGEILIAQSVWQTHITEPKSPKSKAPVPIIPRLACRLDLLRECQGSPASGPMFPNELGRPCDLNNLLNRTILPILNRCEVCKKSELEHEGEQHRYQRDSSVPEWRGWHAFRRGLATNLHRIGVDDKTIQLILRHANVVTTQNIYIKSISEDAREGMARLEQQISLLDSNRTVERAKLDTEIVM
jgi:integrase